MNAQLICYVQFYINYFSNITKLYMIMIVIKVENAGKVMNITFI